MNKLNGKYSTNIIQRVFFDLEDTVIDSFMDNEIFINIHQLKKFIKDRNISGVEIFSKAMWTKKERFHFNEKIRKNFTTILGIDVIGSPIINSELIRMICKLKHINTMTDMNFFNFFSKQDSFILMVEFLIDYKNCKDTHFILVDDMVKTMNIEFVHKNVMIEIINIRDIVNNSKYNLE